MDKYSKARIELLHPSVRCEVTNIINECEKALTGRAKVRITQGLRTDAEQTALYAQGRTAPGKIVTNAKAGQSIHNYGFAVDICLIIDGVTASWDTKTDWDGDKKADWMEVVEIFKKHGWEWGGDWKSFKDMPHFEKKGFGDYKKFQNLKKDKEGYVLLLLMIMLSLMFLSCGSRKTSKTSYEKIDKTETSSSGVSSENKEVIKEVDVVKEVDKNSESDISNEDEYLEPIDPKLPMSKTTTKDGNTTKTTYENAKVNNKSSIDKSKSKETTKEIDKSKESEKSEKTSKVNSSAKSAAVLNIGSKDTSTGFSWWWLLLLIPISLIVYYCKNSPIVKKFFKKIKKFI